MDLGYISKNYLKPIFKLNPQKALLNYQTSKLEEELGSMEDKNYISDAEYLLNEVRKDVVTNNDILDAFVEIDVGKVFLKPPVSKLSDETYEPQEQAIKPMRTYIIKKTLNSLNDFSDVSQMIRDLSNGITPEGVEIVETTPDEFKDTLFTPDFEINNYKAHSSVLENPFWKQIEKNS